MTTMKVKAVYGPSPLDIAAHFKAGWSVSRIVKESGLERKLVEDILRMFVSPGGSKGNVKSQPK